MDSVLKFPPTFSALCADSQDDIENTLSDDGAFNQLGYDEDQPECLFHSDGVEDEDPEFVVPMTHAVEDPRFGNLVSAPGITAEKISVSYTKAARKLDVRQMKRSFWQVLAETPSHAKMEGEKPFSALYQEAAKHLTEKNRTNMNLAIAFVATLSLCNEKHLVLTPEEASSDFLVSQAPDPHENSRRRSPRVVYTSSTEESSEDSS